MPKQYEYLVRSFHNGKTYQDELNALGLNGWKLVGMSGIECVFIRRLEAPTNHVGTPLVIDSDLTDEEWHQLRGMEG